MSKLYALTDAYQALWSLVEDDETDLTIIEEALQGVEDAIETKAGNIALFIRDLDDEAKIIKAEEERLYARRKALENKRDGIKGFLLQAMDHMEMPKIKTKVYTITCANSPASIAIMDESLIPERFLTYIPASYTPRKKDILEAWKNGEVIPGTQLVQNRNLRIR